MAISIFQPWIRRTHEVDLMHLSFSDRRYTPYKVTTFVIYVICGLWCNNIQTTINPLNDILTSARQPHCTALDQQRKSISWGFPLLVTTINCECLSRWLQGLHDNSLAWWRTLRSIWTIMTLPKTCWYGCNTSSNMVESNNCTGYQW